MPVVHVTLLALLCSGFLLCLDFGYSMLVCIRWEEQTSKQVSKLRINCARAGRGGK
jgi:hypothetical protein